MHTGESYNISVCSSLSSGLNHLRAVVQILLLFYAIFRTEKRQKAVRSENTRPYLEPECNKSKPAISHWWVLKQLLAFTTWQTHTKAQHRWTQLLFCWQFAGRKSRHSRVGKGHRVKTSKTCIIFPAAFFSLSILILKGSFLLSPHMGMLSASPLLLKVTLLVKCVTSICMTGHF